MKKILKNKKGFTLIELLAVIVVLAIIMVIATQQVNKTIKKARANSFVSSYKMIVKEIKSRMAMEGLGEGDTIECTGDECLKSYDISKDDYEMEVQKNEEDTTKWNLNLTGKGKFSGMSLTDSSTVKCPIAGACSVGTGDKKGETTIKVTIDENGHVTKQ